MALCVCALSVAGFAIDRVVPTSVYQPVLYDGFRGDQLKKTSFLPHQPFSRSTSSTCGKCCSTSTRIHVARGLVVAIGQRIFYSSTG